MVADLEEMKAFVCLWAFIDLELVKTKKRACYWIHNDNKVTTMSNEWIEREKSPEKWWDLWLNVHKHMETWDILAITDAFLNEKRVNVCEHSVKWHYVSVHEKCHQGVARQEAERGGEVGGKMNWRLSEVNAWARLEDRTNW